MWFYSPSKSGFYNDSVHKSIPSDSLEISRQKYTGLMMAQRNGKVIDFDGVEPVAVDPVATAEQQAEINKAMAVDYLNRTDWYVVRMLETGEQVPQDVQIKRAQMRQSMNE